MTVRDFVQSVLLASGLDDKLVIKYNGKIIGDVTSVVRDGKGGLEIHVGHEDSSDVVSNS